ncbi:MAG: chromate resistance protein [Magnetospirillum sp. WYHS-4]
MSFIALFVTLPTKSGTGRMRVWRASRALGCATLRDGVYLLPEGAAQSAALATLAAEALAAGGTAEIFRLAGRDEIQDAGLRALFDRTAEFVGLVGEIRQFVADLERNPSGQAARRLQVLSRRLDQVVGIDFFPGEAQRQAQAALAEAKAAAVRHSSPDEPGALPDAVVARLARADYRGRIWATRRNLWVDRMASAWLIRRHIDPDARFVWLDSPADCRAEWLGFDFDGAAFTHTGNRVTFETLLATFGLDGDAALARIGEIVHFLDVGGLPVAEAHGVEAILGGLRRSAPDDDRLLDLAAAVFDGLQASFEQGTAR